MKNKILGGVFLLVCLFMFCFKFNLVFAENELGNFILRPLPGTEVKTTVTELANVNIGNLQIIQDKNSINKFQIIFDISNDGAEAQGSLVYGIELLKRENTQSQEMVSLDVQYFPQETFSLNAKGLIQKKIEYTFPQFLTGKAELWLKVKNASGLSMGSAMSEVNLNGAGQYVELANPCYFTINDNQKEYNLIQGVDITKEEALFFNCQVINQTDQSVELQPEQTIYRRSSVNEKEKATLSTEKITLPAKKSVLIKIKVENPKNPQAYDIAFNLKKDNTLFSNTVFGHFVLNGQSGMINLASFDKDAYLASDVAMLSVLLSGPADGFVGARNKKSVLSEPQLEIKITNEKNIQCTKNFKEKIDYFGEVKKISIPIETDCRNFTALVQLKDGEKILDEKKIIINSTSQKIATDKQVIDKPEAKKNILLWVVLILLILPLVVALIHWRKKKKIHLTFSVVLFSCLVSSSMLFTNLVMANTVQLENCFLIDGQSKTGVSVESNLTKCASAARSACGVGVDINKGSCSAVDPQRTISINLYKDLYYHGCYAAYFDSFESVCLQYVKDHSLTPCGIMSAVGYGASCPPSADALSNIYNSFWDIQVTTFGCYCDKASFNFNLDKVFPNPYAPGGEMRITGNITADAACNNGITAGMKYDAFSGTHTFDWLVGATGPVDLTKTTQSSSSFIKIETVPLIPTYPVGALQLLGGDGMVYFKYGFLHGAGASGDVFTASSSVLGASGTSTILYKIAPASSTGQITVVPNPAISPAHPILTWTTTGASGTKCECTGAVPIAPGDWYRNNDECYRAGISAECTASGYDFKWFGWTNPVTGIKYPATGTETCTCKPINASDGKFGTPFSATFSVISAPPPIIYACNTPEPPAGGKRCAGTAETGFSSTVSWSKVGTCTAGGQCEYTVCTPNPQCVQGDCSSQCGGSVLYYCRDIAGCTATPICSSDCSKQMTACSACSSGEWREVAP